MARRNLADPDYEPTDEELRELMQRAFAGVTARRAWAEQQMRARMALARERAAGAARGPKDPQQ